MPSSKDFLFLTKLGSCNAILPQVRHKQRVPSWAKATILSYIGTYYAIGSAWILTLANYSRLSKISVRNNT
jgi:hypothetical protein